MVHPNKNEKKAGKVPDFPSFFQSIPYYNRIRGNKVAFSSPICAKTR
jgi:hypothetical protein